MTLQSFSATPSSLQSWLRMRDELAPVLVLSSPASRAFGCRLKADRVVVKVSL